MNNLTKIFKKRIISYLFNNDNLESKVYTPIKLTPIKFFFCMITIYCVLKLIN